MSFILQRESDSFDITKLYWIYLFLLSIPTQLMMFLGSWKKNFMMRACCILPALSNFKYPGFITPTVRLSWVFFFFASTWWKKQPTFWWLKHNTHTQSIWATFFFEKCGIQYFINLNVKFAVVNMTLKHVNTQGFNILYASLYKKLKVNEDTNYITIL